MHKERAHRRWLVCWTCKRGRSGPLLLTKEACFALLLRGAVLPKQLDNGVMASVLRVHERRIAVLRARAGEEKRHRGEGGRERGRERARAQVHADVGA